MSCGASEGAVAALEPLDVITGWFDAGVVEGGKNKLVPSVTLKLRNKSDEPIRSVQVNAIFRRVGEQEMWGEYFGWAIPRQPLPAGATTNTLVMRSALGTAEPAVFCALAMINALTPLRELGRSGAAVSATSTSPFGST